MILLQCYRILQRGRTIVPEVYIDCKYQVYEIWQHKVHSAIKILFERYENLSVIRRLYTDNVITIYE